MRKLRETNTNVYVPRKGKIFKQSSRGLQKLGGRLTKKRNSKRGSYKQQEKNCLKNKSLS